jgi:hypothetical protein
VSETLLENNFETDNEIGTGNGGVSGCIQCQSPYPLPIHKT